MVQDALAHLCPMPAYGSCTIDMCRAPMHTSRAGDIGEKDPQAPTVHPECYWLNVGVCPDPDDTEIDMHQPCRRYWERRSTGAYKTSPALRQ